MELRSENLLDAVDQEYHLFDHSIQNTIDGRMTVAHRVEKGTESRTFD